MRWRFATAVFAIVSCSGCALVIPGYTLTAPPQSRDMVRAGVGRVDITPPAGYPTGGHGPAGSLARGYWTRLYARAFYFQDADRRAVVLVSCDLFAVPAGVRAEVMRKTSLKWATRGVVLPTASYVIAATHTHQGPGNYLSAAGYNEFGSKYGGFDRALFNFFVKRISQAIDAAIQDALDHDSPTLSVQTGRVHADILMNRSPVTFLTNWNASTLADEWHQETIDCHPAVDKGEARANGWMLPGCPRLRGFDPALTTLQVRRDRALIGALVFTAVHPTVLYHGAPLYSSDFVGAALRSIERELASGLNGRLPVVGFFNGAEGDVVARRGQRDLRDVLRVATLFAADVRSMLTGGRSIDPVVIERREKRVTFGDAPSASMSLAKAPVMGAPGLGGGEDDRTVLYQLGFAEGLREIPAYGQGGKLPALDSQLLSVIRLTALFAPPWKFPGELPVSYIRIGAFTIGALPVEVSSAQGAAIRERLGRHGEFELIGLANEYASYTVTADEYEVQDYMGASTLWGPKEGDVFLQTLDELKQSTAPVSLIVPKQRFRPGSKPSSPRFKALGPSAVGERMPSADSELERVLLDQTGVPARNLPMFVWQEQVADNLEEFSMTSRRYVRILQGTLTGWVPRRALDGGVDDDQGIGLVTLMQQTPAAGLPARDMVSIWVSPAIEQNPPGGEFKYEVWLVDVLGQQKCLESDPFPVNLHPSSRHPLLTAHECPATASAPSEAPR
jgi:neutral ceramidase